MTMRYRTKLRPAAFGGLPQGLVWRYVELPNDGSVYRGHFPLLPVSQHRYGVIETDRALTRDEMSHFDIVEAL